MISGPCRSVWSIVAMFVLLPVLYVGGLGPVEWLDDRNYLRGSVREVAEVAYGPLSDWVDGEPNALKRVLRWYVELWG